MVDEHCVTVDAGAVQLVVESRQLTNAILADTYDEDVSRGVSFDDFGASVHVCDSVDGVEYLRFDCFEHEPHYHYIEPAAGANTVVRIDELAVGDPIEFTLACIERRLPAMLRHCGRADLADAVAADPARLADALPQLRALLRQADNAFDTFRG